MWPVGGHDLPRPLKPSRAFRPRLCSLRAQGVVQIGILGTVVAGALFAAVYVRLLRVGLQSVLKVQFEIAITLQMPR